MMFMGSDISSSSIEVMPNGIGSELEGRPEILRMDQNPQQLALPLNPHALPAIPHAEQQAEMNHPAPALGDPEIPLIPELPNPLIADEVRMWELYCRLALHGSELSPESLDHILASQAVIENKVEAALVADGFHPNLLIENRDKVRGFLFYPRGTVLSHKTYFFM